MKDNSLLIGEFADEGGKGVIQGGGGDVDGVLDVASDVIYFCVNI